MEIQIKNLGLKELSENSCLIEEIKGFDELDEKFYDLMVCSVSDSVLGTLKSCGKSGSAMWNRLESEFNRKDVASKYSVLAQLLSYRYIGNGIQTHCDDVIALINTLIAKEVNFDSELGVCILLFSLPAEYSTFVTTISAQVGVTLTVDMVRTRVIAEEMRLRRTGSDAVLFSNSKHQNRNFTGGPKKGGLEKRKGKCFKCKKLGHWARDYMYGSGTGITGTLLNNNPRALKFGMGVTYYHSSKSTKFYENIFKNGRKIPSPEFSMRRNLQRCDAEGRSCDATYKDSTQRLGRATQLTQMRRNLRRKKYILLLINSISNP
jgi:hypothetical protein